MVFKGREERGMIINIGTGVDESVVMWKYNDKEMWRDADIDVLIHLYESVVHCKDCKWYECGGLPCPLDVCETLGDDGFCSRGEGIKNENDGNT